jgi:hypothetical protein
VITLPVTDEADGDAVALGVKASAAAMKAAMERRRR